MARILEPDFDSIVVENKPLGNGEASKVHANYSDSMLSGYSAVILNDSTPEDKNTTELDGSRLITMIARFPRCVLSEVNTHRVFSRNSASSRARSFKTTITEIMEDPYIPLFTKNMRGMGGDYLTAWERELAVEKWLKARDQAVASTLTLLMADVVDDSVNNVFTAGDLHEGFGEGYKNILDRYNTLYKAEDASILSVHKQNANRLLEPFMWHEAIISSTYWENFFKLRDHKDAQPEIRAIARLMHEAIQASEPEKTSYHIPFKDNHGDISNWQQARELFMDSAGDCARVSYKSKLQTGSTDSRKLGERLLEDGHMSPFEHIAVSRETLINNAQQWGIDPHNFPISNFDSNWVQFRGLLENEVLS